VGFFPPFYFSHWWIPLIFLVRNFICVHINGLTNSSDLEVPCPTTKAMTCLFNGRYWSLPPYSLFHVRFVLLVITIFPYIKLKLHV
jgi:hypothetical protein